MWLKGILRLCYCHFVVKWFRIRYGHGVAPGVLCSRLFHLRFELFLSLTSATDKRLFSIALFCSFSHQCHTLRFCISQSLFPVATPKKYATQAPSTKHINPAKHTLLNLFILFPCSPFPFSPPPITSFLSFIRPTFINLCFLVHCKRPISTYIEIIFPVEILDSTNNVSIVRETTKERTDSIT